MKYLKNIVIYTIGEVRKASGDTYIPKHLEQTISKKNNNKRTQIVYSKQLGHRK